MNTMALFSIVILFVIVQPTYQKLYSCNPSDVCGCSLHSASVSRIVGGENAGASTWSWVASINISNVEFCGGSIISASWIITAAHCVQYYLNSSISISVGSNAKFNGTQNQLVSKIIIHPQFDGYTFENDIALLYLDPPLNMADPNVRTICMPNVSQSILDSQEWPVPQTSVSVIVVI